MLTLQQQYCSSTANNGSLSFAISERDNLTFSYLQYVQNTPMSDICVKKLEFSGFTIYPFLFHGNNVNMNCFSHKQYDCELTKIQLCYGVPTLTIASDNFFFFFLFLPKLETDSFNVVTSLLYYKSTYHYILYFLCFVHFTSQDPDLH